MHAIRLKGENEGHIAALSGISRKGDHVICQFSSIDERLAAEASPGEFLYWQMISGMHGKGVALFDFGLGDQIYKRSWAPVETGSPRCGAAGLPDRKHRRLGAPCDHTQQGHHQGPPRPV